MPTLAHDATIDSTAEVLDDAGFASLRNAAMDKMIENADASDGSGTPAKTAESTRVWIAREISGSRCSSRS